MTTTYKTLADVYARENRTPGFARTSMFFNPFREGAVYLVKETDQLLFQTDTDEYFWSWPAQSAIGRDIKDIMAENADIKDIQIPVEYNFSSDGIHSAGAYFDWGALGMGFGQMSFSLNKDTGKVEFDTECMGRESTRAMLHQFVDFIIDNGVSDDWNPRDYQYKEDEDE